MSSTLRMIAYPEPMLAKVIELLRTLPALPAGVSVGDVADLLHALQHGGREVSAQPAPGLRPVSAVPAPGPQPAFEDGV